MGASSAERPDREWTPARLIPVVGMKGAKEQEDRATSALLAVMQVVPSFGKAVLRYLDAPSGRITCFTQPRFTTDEGEATTPDGAIVVEWGKSRWVCLVEVKTGPSALQAAQVEKYLKIAVRDGFNAVLTVSNQIVPSPSDLPVVVSKPLLKKVKVRHLSWFRIFTEAVVEQEHHGVKDPEQAKVLDDLIVFLDDERSGAGGYEGMGKAWVAVRDAANKGLLGPAAPGVREVAESWGQFLEYLCLRLRQDLGRPVTPIYPKDSDARVRLQSHVKSLGESGRLEGTLKVPDAASPIIIEADLRALQVTTRVQVSAPREGKPKTRINWLLRQLRDTPPDLRVEVHYPYTHHTPIRLVHEAKQRSDMLLLPDDPKRPPSHFDVALTAGMGIKRGKAKGSFVDQTTNQVLQFYRSTVQDIRRWTPRPPQLRKEAKAPEGEEQALEGNEQTNL